jgi:hypothetical protein
LCVGVGDLEVEGLIGERHRLARDRLIARGCVVEEDGLDDGGLLEIVRREALVDIQVAVDAASLIVARILNKLEGWNADRVEAILVGRAAGAE